MARNSLQGDRSHVGMTICFYCREPSGLVLDMTLRDTLPREAIYDMEPCSGCRAIMDSGGLLIIGTTTSAEEVQRQQAEYNREIEKQTNLHGKAWVARHCGPFVLDIDWLGVIGITKEARLHNFPESENWTLVNKKGFDFMIEQAKKVGFPIKGL